MPAKSFLLRVCRFFCKVCVAHLMYFVQGCHSPPPNWYCQHLSLMLRSLALRTLDWSVLMPFFPSVQHMQERILKQLQSAQKVSFLSLFLPGVMSLLVACDGIDCPLKLFSPTVRDALEHASEFKPISNDLKRVPWKNLEWDRHLRWSDPNNTVSVML